LWRITDFRRKSAIRHRHVALAPDRGLADQTGEFVVEPGGPVFQPADMLHQCLCGSPWVARAKSRTWRGLTTATAIPAVTRALATGNSRPPVASIITKSAALKSPKLLAHSGLVVGLQSGISFPYSRSGLSAAKERRPSLLDGVLVPRLRRPAAPRLSMVLLHPVHIRPRKKNAE
jgi:hypothetical protein